MYQPRRKGQKSTGTIQLVDAYNVFRLDSVSNEIALKAGVPVKQLSDIEIGKLMNPQSDFISDLKNMKETNFLWANYGAYSWSHSSTGYSVSMQFTIRNSSSQTISGKDYYIIVSPSQKSTGHTFATKTIDGVDLAPNEVREFIANEPSLYRYASERDLAYGVDVKYRTESIMNFLLNYCEFNGKEYQDFMKHPYRARLKSHGVSGMVSSEKNGFAYAYKEMSDKSKVVDTLYHHKGIRLIWESEAWASVFHFDEHFDDIFIGYMKAEDIDISPDGLGLYLAVVALKSDNGKVNVCDDNGRVIKTIPARQKATIEPTEDGDPFLFERLPNGSVKKIGRISSENINWEEGWSPL